MIEQATRRRLAGDWRGACAAAHVDVAPDLDYVANTHGAETADRLEEDLWYFAPDLVRWHLPRYLRGRTTLRPGQCVILAGYGGRPVDAPYLYVTTLMMIDGPQRLTLQVDGRTHAMPRIHLPHLHRHSHAHRRPRA